MRRVGVVASVVVTAAIGGPAMAMTAIESTAGGRGDIAIVLLGQVVRIDATKVATEYNERWKPLKARPVASQGSSFTLDLGDARATVNVVRVPVSRIGMEKAAQASWQWSRAAEVLKHHLAHLVVEVQSQGPGSLENITRLTRLTAAVVATVNSSAVFWPNAAMLIDPKRFVAESAGMARHEVPLKLWVNFLPAKLPAGTLVVHTIGLASLDMPELIVADEGGHPGATLNTIFRVSEYVVLHGLLLKRGDTLKLNDKETLVAEEIEAPWNEKETAIRLTLQRR